MKGMQDNDSQMVTCKPIFCFMKGMQQEDSVGLSSLGNFRSRKDAHKCQHCGKFISGHVAFRGEILVFFDSSENLGSL